MLIYRSYIVATIGLLLLGCGDSSEGLRWSVVFDNDGLRDQAARVRVQVAMGPCTADGNLLYETSGPGDLSGTPTLKPGTYALRGEAVNDNCEVYADGCTTVELPAGGTSADVILRARVDVVARCPASACDGGRCSDSPECACNGDINGDGRVTFSQDLSRGSLCIGSPLSEPCAECATTGLCLDVDLNCDGVVNFCDIARMGCQIAASGGGTPAQCCAMACGGCQADDGTCMVSVADACAGTFLGDGVLCP